MSVCNANSESTLESHQLHPNLSKVWLGHFYTKAFLLKYLRLHNFDRTLSSQNKCPSVGLNWNGKTIKKNIVEMNWNLRIEVFVKIIKMKVNSIHELKLIIKYKIIQKTTTKLWKHWKKHNNKNIVIVKVENSGSVREEVQEKSSEIGESFTMHGSFKSINITTNNNDVDVKLKRKHNFAGCHRIWWIIFNKTMNWTFVSWVHKQRKPKNRMKSAFETVGLTKKHTK